MVTFASGMCYIDYQQMSKKIDYFVLKCRYCEKFIGTLWAIDKPNVGCETCCEKIDKWNSMIKEKDAKNERRFKEYQDSLTALRR